MALDYYEAALFETLPALYGEIEQGACGRVPGGDRGKALPVLLRFGSWIGGDRDGNPFVTPATTAEALTMARDLLYAHYLRRLQNVFEQLASSTQQVPVSDALQKQLNTYLAELRTAGPESPALQLLARFPHESVRLLVACVMIRLGGTPSTSLQAGTGSGVAGPPVLAPYTRATELLADLEVLRESLRDNRGQRLATLLIDPLVLEARTYGLHLQALDIRQHARVHAAALKEIAAALAGAENDVPALSPQSAEVLETFRAVAMLKRTHPPEALPRYVISGAASAADILNSGAAGADWRRGRGRGRRRSRAAAGAAV